METGRSTGHALVVGAGIGGLATALALGRTGWRVTVLEQAAAIGEVGAGIQLSPNGVRVLSSLGVLEELLPTTFRPEAVEMRLGRSASNSPRRQYGGGAPPICTSTVRTCSTPFSPGRPAAAWTSRSTRGRR
jgi:2-polyprenyl-6-methoxyphenol hydroxylase-like FAD-dependent oxidoreductase